MKEKDLNWQALLLLVLGGIVVGGLFWDSKGFFINFASGILDVFVGFFIAVLFLDQIQSKLRAQEWERVREVTYSSITSHIIHMLTQVFIDFNSIVPNIIEYQSFQIGQGVFHPNKDTLNAMRKFALQLNKIPVEIQLENSDRNLVFFDHVIWDLSRLGDILIPRVLQFSNDVKIIDSLIRLDQTREQFTIVVMAEKRLYSKMQFTFVVLLVLHMCDVYEALLSSSVENS